MVDALVDPVGAPHTESYAWGVQGSSRGRILVVDDDAAIRALLTRYLEVEGYVVDQAADAHTAYKALSGTRPDLVLLDVMLSPDDGLEVLSRSARRATLR